MRGVGMHKSRHRLVTCQRSLYLHYHLMRGATIVSNKLSRMVIVRRSYIYDESHCLVEMMIIQHRDKRNGIEWRVSGDGKEIAPRLPYTWHEREHKKTLRAPLLCAQTLQWSQCPKRPGSPTPTLHLHIYTGATSGMCEALASDVPYT